MRKAGKTAAAQMLEQFLRIGLTSYFFSFLLPSGIEGACLSMVLGSTISETTSCLFLFILYLWEKKKKEKIKKTEENYKKRIFQIAVPIAFTSYIRSGLNTLKQILTPVKLEASRHFV